MSLPAALSAPLLISTPLDGFLNIFNSNPYFIGIMMLILNIGGRFITLEITKQQEQFLQIPIVRRLLIFTVLFVATRNIWVAFWATITVVLLLGYLFNENSALCIFGKIGKEGSTCAKEEMTPEEKETFYKLTITPVSVFLQNFVFLKELIVCFMLIKMTTWTFSNSHFLSCNGN